MKKLILIFLMAMPFTFVLKADPVSYVLADPYTNGPGFTMSPNPVSGTFFYINLDFSEAQYPNAVINITNVLGQVVYTYVIKSVDFTQRQVRVDLSEAKLDKGIYLVQVKSGEYAKTQKLAIR